MMPRPKPETDLQAHLEELRAIIEDAEAAPDLAVAAILWRLRTLYRVVGYFENIRINLY